MCDPVDEGAVREGKLAIEDALGDQRSFEIWCLEPTRANDLGHCDTVSKQEESAVSAFGRDGDDCPVVCFIWSRVALSNASRKSRQMCIGGLCLILNGNILRLFFMSTGKVCAVIAALW